MELVNGTPLTIDDIQARLPDRKWYLTAEEALKIGQMAGVI